MSTQDDWGSEIINRLQVFLDRINADPSLWPCVRAGRTVDGICDCPLHRNNVISLSERRPGERP